MKKKERELVEKLLTEWIVCYKDCFCQDSSEKWIKIFAEKRLETFLADKKDYIEEITGVDLSNSKNLKEFRSLYKSMFLEIITNSHLSKLIFSSTLRRQFTSECSLSIKFSNYHLYTPPIKHPSQFS